MWGNRKCSHFLWPRWVCSKAAAGCQSVRVVSVKKKEKKDGKTQQRKAAQRIKMDPGGYVRWLRLWETWKLLHVGPSPHKTTKSFLACEDGDIYRSRHDVSTRGAALWFQAAAWRRVRKRFPLNPSRRSTNGENVSEDPFRPPAASQSSASEPTTRTTRRPPADAQETHDQHRRDACDRTELTPASTPTRHFPGSLNDSPALPRPLTSLSQLITPLWTQHLSYGPLTAHGLCVFAKNSTSFYRPGEKFRRLFAQKFWLKGGRS